MVENIIATALFNTKYVYNTQDKYDIYRQLLPISHHSFTLTYPEASGVIITGDFKNTNYAFKHIFMELYKLWKSKPCNILFHDVDCLSIQWAPFFRLRGQFLLFNRAPSHIKTDLVYRVCSIRYFPYDMPEELWQLGIQLWNSVDLETTAWETEQIIYNKMLYSLHNNLLNDRMMLIPEWNYIDLKDPSLKETQDDVNIPNINVYQLCATRGHEETLKILTDIYNSRAYSYHMWKLSPVINELTKKLNSLLMKSLSDHGYPKKIIGNLFYHHHDGDIEDRKISPLFETKRSRLHMIAQRAKVGLEIGLSGGHSAMLMLTSNPLLTLIANDIAEHIDMPDMSTYHPEVYVPVAADFLKDTFKERFTFIKGNCLEKIPEAVKKWISEGIKFDLVHLDGAKETYYQDFKNLIPVINKNAYVIFDDSEMRIVINTVSKLISEGFLVRDPEFPSMALDESQRHEVLRFSN